MKIYQYNKSLYFSTYVTLATEKVVRITFSGGINFGSRQTKSTFSTSDKLLQEAIEKDPSFLDGSISLQFSDEGKPQKSTKRPVATSAKDFQSVESVKTWQQAKDFLKKAGVSASELTDPDSIKAAADNNNIEFPNLA